ncbi:hypothetical protein OVA24_14585 [Luteolibacter sp. SL250]|uniref:hypothetical protein n=1 Tax=Luteolibacter sp. SL250 TaxID=2995170 RepID=UPI00226F8965|nr:hypothetical protein [Luteolibacter sp. SL250]WAC18459.1 hypothetical protein OVA24_14585 [Luteolibacter sp. SL250]
MFEDRGGILTFVGGLVALTVVATGLALVMEKRSEASNRKTDAEKTFADDSQIIEVLRDELDRTNEKWRENSGRTATDEKYKAAKAGGDELAAKLAGLRDQHGALKASVEEQERAFSGYREQYVGSVRGAAEDEKIDVLRLKSGREYSQVVIKKVTSEGLEIRHEFGSARVLAEDLDEKWNERFLWH